MGHGVRIVLLLRGGFRPDWAQLHGVTARIQKRIWTGALAGGLMALSAHAVAAECAPPLDPSGTLPTFHDRLTEVADVTRIYQRSGNRCLWGQNDTGEAMTIFAAAAGDGLDPSDFHLSELRALGDATRAEMLRDRDVLLTDAALHYARIMTRGQVDLADIDTDIEFSANPVSSADDITSALTTGRAGAYLAGLAPRAAEYGRLKSALAQYRELTAKGGWLLLPEGPSLRPGDSGAAIAALGARLKAEGDLTEPFEDVVYGGPLVGAVKNFQSRHGLNADGVVGPKTRAALNIAAQARVQQIEINLERWRILGYAVPATRFEVNVPAAAARLVMNGDTVLDMRAVVGDPKHPTPMLASRITDVVINPIWTVPPSIVKAEIEPILRRDPGYLERNNMHWMNGNLVQDPGGTNPLGRLRFTFANKFGVYLHDTSAPALFANDNRARSHGCLRLEKPLDLAAALLAENPTWPREKIEETIAGGATIRIPLMKPVPVVIAYWTAFVDPDGTIEFRNDVYGRDERLAGALAALRAEQSRTGRIDDEIRLAEACGKT
jgi:murein L,D-transpeptidase YcbB/YkuD